MYCRFLAGDQVASTYRQCTKGTATLENPWWNSVQSLTARQWRNRCLWSNSKRIYLIKMNWWLLCWFYVLTVQELMKWHLFIILSIEEFIFCDSFLFIIYTISFLYSHTTAVWVMQYLLFWIILYLFNKLTEYMY